MAIKKRKTFYKKSRPYTVVTPTVNGQPIEQYLLEWFAERFLYYVRREMTSGIFEKPTGTSLRSWRYKIEGNKIRFFNKDYAFYLNKGRKSQAMKWLEGKTVPMKIGGQTIFRKAIGVGRPNANSKWGKLFYMKQPDKGKPYLGFIDRALEKANKALLAKIKRGK